MLEDALAESDGPWILGSNPTLADINLMPYVARLDYLGLFELWIRDRSRVKAWWTWAREWPSSRNGLSDHISEAQFSEMSVHGPKIAGDLAETIQEIRSNKPVAAH